jgi:hypothetical protein
VKITKWNADKVEAKATQIMERRVALASVVVQGEVKRKLNRSNRGGTEPSAPGQPPNKGSGDLQRSIFQEVTRVGKMVHGFVGSRLLKARRLELGYVGRDRLGRTVDQKPRPFLRSTLVEQRDRLRSILLGGKK